MNKIIYITYILCFIDVVISVPPLYCLQRLNSSDCLGAPTPVFSYYKPGSRCEIEIWRGCPTMNRFEDEYQCSHYCIGRFLHIYTDNFKLNQSSCNEIFQRSKCSERVVKVYTYNRKNKICEPAVWRGCNTGNKFPDESTCNSVCKNNDEGDGFEKKFNNLVPDDVKKVDSILDSIIGNDEEELKYIPSSLKHGNENFAPKVPEVISTTSSTITDSNAKSTPKSTTNDTNISTALDPTTITTTATILFKPTTITEESMSKTEIPMAKTTVATLTTVTIRPSGTVEEVVLPGDEIKDRSNKTEELLTIQ